jgi:hypothetical protein
MPLTPRERILSVLRFGVADRIPWNMYAWLLPKTAFARSLLPHGLSLMGTQRIFRETFSGLTIREETSLRDGQTWFHKMIETPLGTLDEISTIEQNYFSRWIKKYFISRPEDFPVAEYIFRHTWAEPEYEIWRRSEAEMGHQGFVVGEVMPIPIMTLIVSWMGIEGLVDGLYTCPDEFEALLEAAERLYDRQIQLAAESPAEIIWFGDNVTAKFISPKLYERFCVPTYARVMPVMRSAGKIPIAHYDGSNRPLLKGLARTALPVIEAFTPPPMGDLGVAEAKAAWPDKVIWVNFPGNMFLEPFETIKEYTLDLLQTSAPGGRLIIGCTEEFPLDEYEKTFTAIGQALAEYEGREWEQENRLHH